ncbi:unnamed protein product [Brachionus calyciflorus]|uniref:Uncharacterized protein n=1 Tax=Brachionus calyciflorus TaxID=104777 RepID=A0A813YGZ2_9BILA|nr:unnamed protein product [Brachionus calyciflorus]
MGKKKVSDNVKWQIVGLFKGGGKTQQEIAELVGVSQKCVSSITKKHESTGQVGAYGANYKNLAVDFNAKFSNVKVSKATIRRLQIKKGLVSHTVRKPLLTAKDRIKSKNGVSKG